MTNVILPIITSTTYVAVQHPFNILDGAMQHPRGYLPVPLLAAFKCPPSRGQGYTVL